jgi:preprotein translocase subunit SecA
MTGTADTEATEFKQIYALDVTIIPTNRPNIRKDEPDTIYKSEAAKLKAISEEIKAAHLKGQPVLVGTISVDKSEQLAAYLKKDGIKHNVLNAKQHEREADIVAQAGRKGAVTISTNMAGRGTDILLGGNSEFLAKQETGPLDPAATQEEQIAWKEKFETITREWDARTKGERDDVLASGGLYILGTERHESRRIDNQLRGRSGRQGDPGKSKFYLSLDDDLMRIFGGVNIKRFMEDDLPIEHPWITKAIANAQKKVEGHNYDIRKHLLEYDDVMNQQRKVVYSWRREVLSQPNLREMVFSMVGEIVAAISEDFFPGGKIRKIDGSSSLNIKELNEAVAVTFQTLANITENMIQPLNGEGLKKLLLTIAEAAYQAKETTYSPDIMRQVEKMVLLGTIDQLWKDHLLAMDHMRDGIGLQGYGQKDPLVEYKKQGFKFFEMMMAQIAGDVVRKLFAVQITATPGQAIGEDEFEGDEIEEAPIKNPVKSLAEGGRLPTAGEALRGQTAQPRAPLPTLRPLPPGVDVSRVGRNDDCPCGSGKKFKKCHGANL